MVKIEHSLEYYIWYPISKYPRDHLDWGPEAIFEVLPSEEYPYAATRYYGHLEAGMWLVRDCDDPCSWAAIFKQPNNFMLIEETRTADAV